jgi:hypothetical protein
MCVCRGNGRAHGREETKHEGRRFRRAEPVFFLLGIAGLLFAACGGASGPGVASLGSTTTTTVPSGVQGGTSSARYVDAVKFSECMRTHGVPNFPDPLSGGVFIKETAPGHPVSINGVAGIDPQSSPFVSANKSCRHLLANEGKPTAAQDRQQLAQALKFSQCMRTHGVPNFPDPQVTSNGSFFIAAGGLINAPNYQSASEACKKYALPTG